MAEETTMGGDDGDETTEVPEIHPNAPVVASYQLRVTERSNDPAQGRAISTITDLVEQALAREGFLVNVTGERTDR